MQTFPLNPEQFQTALTKLRAEPGASVNFDPSDNTGECVGDGVSISFHYDGTSTLSVEVEGKPWYMPESVVESHISSFFQ